MRSVSFLLLLFVAQASFAAGVVGDWPTYGGDAGGQRFSALEQITTHNVGTLKTAWVYHTGDAYQPKGKRATAFEATPLYIDGVLYLSTPLGRVIALDPITGKEKWSYSANVNRDAGFGDFASRGVAAWQAADGKRRIYVATLDARLIALDAETGKPCLNFGDNGEINLRNGLRIAPRDFQDYEETSPPAVIGNTIVVGSGISDNNSVGQPSGEVRAFDTETGKLKWSWDPIPQKPGETGADTWKDGSAKKTGAANAWSIIM